LFLLTFSCRNAERGSESAVSNAAAPAAPEAQSRAKSGDPEASLRAAARMIIRTATITLVVVDAPESLGRIVTLIEQEGGYVAETRQWRENDQMRVTATLRVPSARLFDVLPRIREEAIRVESEAVTGQDVSEEFSDLGAQLENLQATETELRELLSTVRQRTQKAADILEVHKELTRVRGEIERIEGRMRYLSQMTDFSTIHVDLIPDVLARPVVEPGWRPLAAAREASRSLVNSLQWIAEAGIWIVVFILPLLLVLAVLLILVRWIWTLLLRRRREPIP
ncbi:MAG TPA: DUF4349 domain-containing protein, partial [Thermoanaerobaculia bacterium]|nr:DUF4349 domain-containing protein [Thermoanaerobaculia bacterium]